MAAAAHGTACLASLLAKSWAAPARGGSLVLPALTSSGPYLSSFGGGGEGGGRQGAPGGMVPKKVAWERLGASPLLSGGGDARRPAARPSTSPPTWLPSTVPKNAQGHRISTLCHPPCSPNPSMSLLTLGLLCLGSKCQQAAGRDKNLP